ncbi:MAG: RT0821/Lpp0805 family surface protein [Geminicoccaceae bacterium]
MTTLEPELLMRYADDEVSGAERRLVEARLPADPGARDLLASFQTQCGLMPAAFNGRDDDQSLPRFEHAINHAFAQRRRRQQRTDIRRWALPLVASFLILLAGGLFAARYVDQRIQSETDRILAELSAKHALDRELALRTRIDALERMISGKTLSWMNEGSGTQGSITPLRTFQTPDGQWCREYRESTSSGSADEDRLSIACRDGNGGWNPPI